MLALAEMLSDGARSNEVGGQQLAWCGSTVWCQGKDCHPTLWMEGECGPHCSWMSGNLREMKAHLHGLGLLTPWEVPHLAREIQFEVLCSGIRIIRRHQAGWTDIPATHLKCDAPAC